MSGREVDGSAHARPDTSSGPLVVGREPSSDVRSVVVEMLMKAARTAMQTVASDAPLGRGGLEIGSLPLLQVFVKLEERFGFAFDDESVATATFNSVGDLVAFVIDAVNARAARIPGRGEVP
jgi:acyl carrier protein